LSRASVQTSKATQPGVSIANWTTAASESSTLLLELLLLLLLLLLLVALAAAWNVYHTFWPAPIDKKQLVGVAAVLGPVPKVLPRLWANEAQVACA